MSKILDLKNKLSDLLSKDPPDFDKILQLSNDLAKEDPNHQRFFVDAKRKY